MSTICKNCKAKDSMIEDINEGEVICSKCGLVYQENLAIEEYIPLNIKKNEKNLRKAQKGSNNKRKSFKKIDRNFTRIRKKLQNAGVNKNLVETTLYLYGTIASKILKINFDHIIIALYYYALRIKKIPQDFKQVARMFPPITERQIKKAFNNIKLLLNEDKNEDEDEDELITREKNLVRLYIGEDQSKYDAKMLSFEIIKNINDNSLLDGKKPNTVAGLALILTYKLLNDKSDINNEFYKTFSSKNSISTSFTKIKKDLNKIIPEKYKNKIKGLKNSKI